jgi:tetratricopeptide (TPR) repeat protein
MKSSDDFPRRVGPAISLSVAPPGEYIKAIRAHIRQGQQRLAYSLLLQACEHYPDNPVILSYCGWLGAVIDKKHKSSIATCRKAFVVFKTANPRTMGTVYPILYLNLGRALFAAGRRQEAVENFKHGLKHDRNHSELKKELQGIGSRQQPLVPFLSRSNPINKYIGKMIRTSHRATQRTVHNPGA